MAKVARRIDGVIKALSPEEKAQLMIEDQFRPDPILSDVEVQGLLRAMNAAEGHRYNAVISRNNILRHNIDILGLLVEEMRTRLLERDRVLWWHRCLVELFEQVVFNPEIAEPLLVNNPNIKSGKPLTIKVFFGQITIGVWGKRRLPLGPNIGVELNERVNDILDLYIQRVRSVAGDAKALHKYISEQARGAGLDFIAGWATMLIRSISGYDLAWGKLTPGSDMFDVRRMSEGDKQEGPQRSARWGWPERPPPCIFPVEDRWALCWDEIEENPGTASQLRADPENWLPVSYGEQIKVAKADLLDDLKTLAAIDSKGE